MGRFECVEDAIGKTGATTVIVPQLLTVILYSKTLASSHLYSIANVSK